ncbi:hypothetical protein LOD99_12852 [Oopsacas minuta]|uniref:Uncharacterized protein n=1 Tax=Oopsacas minuta TaxID=111878 RepID=A0AAV7JD71_9METZ|nr:hypothetical protein LOD99_12852 [Oopsacas minuta]
MNELGEEDLLDCSLRINTGWKEGDLLKAVVEGFNSRKLSMELQNLDSLSFTQLLLSPDKEFPQELSIDPNTPGGDRDSRISEKSLSYDAIALHHSIDHFAQAFISEPVTTETAQPIRIDSDVSWVYPDKEERTDNSDGDSVVDTEDVFEPVVIELEDGNNSYDHDLQVDIDTLDEAVKRLELSSAARPSLPGSRRSSLLIQQERLIISPEKLRASILRRQELDESLPLTDEFRISESPSLARYSSLPVIASTDRLEREASSEISLNNFQQLTHPENLIGKNTNSIRKYKYKYIS